MNIFSLDIRRARKGDCLLLHYGTAAKPKLAMIDGGPDDVYQPHLRPRLEKIRQERVLADDQPLPVDLLMVSHIDDDHIKGILQFTDELVEAQNEQASPFAKIRNFWHNTFDDIIGNTPEELLASVKTKTVTASLDGDIEDDEISHETWMVLSSVDQGFRLRDNARALGLSNVQFEDKLIMEDGGGTLDMGSGLKFVVAGPMKAELVKLHQDHEKFLQEKQKKHGTAVPASFTDTSVANLSSIVVIAKTGGKTMLLTGDARGDKILTGMKNAGLLDNDGKCHVDILKVPHHGSDRNMATSFFEAITADHYVFSGDGEHGNPERGTLQMLLDARGDSDYTVHLTYPVGEIDTIREKVWKEEQKKEKDKNAKAEKAGKPTKPVRENWSDAEHGLQAFLDANQDFAGKIVVTGAEEPHVIDLLDPLGY